MDEIPSTKSASPTKSTEFVTIFFCILLFKGIASYWGFYIKTLYNVKKF